MKNVLFENVGGNQFRLLNENKNVNESLVASGLKKVFMNAGNTISYSHVESVGMGYIKDIPTAKRTALDEARILAKEFGYQDSEDDGKFIKDESDPTEPLKKEGPDETNTEERQEVQIGKAILRILDDPYKINRGAAGQTGIEEIRVLAQKLLKIHG